MTELKPDICVIGAGAAGLSVAVVAGGLGVPVVLVDKGTFGGECLNTGCVPSKALLAAAEAAEAMRRTGPFGIAAARPRVDQARVKQHVDRVIAAIAPNDSPERYAALGVQVLRGEARFTDKRTLVVGDTTIRARRIVLATGSRPALPPVPGLADVPHLTNETIFTLATRPEHLLILGAGPVGLEMAQAWRRLGSAVTVVEAGRALGRIDPEIAGHALAALRAEGIVLHENARIDRAEHWAGGIRLLGAAPGGGAVEGTHLLVAAGRTPTVDGLDLDKAGIRHDRTGILVDKGLRTSNRRVYAIGDCAGGPHAGDRLTHVAAHHAGLVIRSALFRLGAAVETQAVPRAVYTDPEIATVGLDEETARARHRNVRVLRWPFSENDRAQAERRTRGEVKVLTTAKGVILGAAIVGDRAGDLIVPWTLAVKKGLTVADWRDLIVPYPTLSEASKRAALTFYAGEARRPVVGRLLRFLRLFG
ncbi:FAD-dependent oxidoreductase [uncultured Alsobacter sp.]|uniref:dihydrolipoyl dehydrogenase family protein n=1 Tax=uncultured Alsobacter sp. TaxID=1748258 RepID=UPI0026000DDF|nr:FAD-dependent oxidoreductase [uncultured Alsobacter sp.]